MDELIAVLDVKGNATGKTCLKSIVHKKGLYHATVHIWFYTNKGKVLLQQRAASKIIYPLLWDVSVARKEINKLHAFAGSACNGKIF